jgi:hypothetical protein
MQEGSEMQSAVHHSEPLALDLRLPWEEDEAQEQKFQKLLKRFCCPC